MSSKIKVCHYIPHGAIPDKRGFAPSIVVQNYTKTIDKDTIDMFFITNKEDYKKNVETTPYGLTYRIKESRIYRRLFRKITKFDPYPLHIRAAKIINKHPVDIFHAHQIEFPVNEFKKHLINKNIKIVITSHVTVNQYNDSRGYADRYIPVAKYVKNILIQKGYPKHLMNTITNGIDTSMFKPSRNNHHIKEKYQIPQNSIVVSFVGRKQEVKGYDIFLQLAQYLLERYNNVYIISVGPEPSGTEKEKTYQHRKEIEHILSKNKKFIDLPPLKHKSLVEIYQITDITILLSKGEPQGMTMVESISSGCITLSTATGGITETIKDNYNGFLMPESASIEDVIKKVEFIIKNLSSRKMEEIKANGRKIALEKFDTKTITNKLESLYKEIINE